MISFVSPALAAVILYLHATILAAQPAWHLQRDNLSEYRLVEAKIGVRTDRECVMLASETEKNFTVHGVAFDAAIGNCSMFQCLMGDGGCRKCRNAKNTSLPFIWARSLNSPNNCWTTFQHRVDDSVSFNRNWTNYTVGFGQGEDLNYWMGLDALSQLTLASNCNADTGRCRIRWEFSDWNDNWYWAENVGFSVASAVDRYRLRMGALDTSRSNVGQYPLTDRYSPNNRQFSTPDFDNDICSCNCANVCGWWYGWCTSISPNNLFYNPPVATSGSAQNAMYYIYPSSVSPLVTTYSMKTFELMVLTAAVP